MMPPEFWEEAICVFVWAWKHERLLVLQTILRTCVAAEIINLVVSAIIQ